MRKATLSCLLGCLLLLAASSLAQALVAPGLVMPAMSLPDTKGGQHDLAQMVKGKVALMVYWSVSCPHCREEMPHLMALAKRFAGNPFVLVLVNTDGLAMSPAVEAYAAEQRLPGPLLMDAGPKDTLPFAELFDIVATPGVLVLDRSGKLTLSQELRVDMDKVGKAIEAGF